MSYFNNYFAENYFTDTYWGLSDGEVVEVITGAYRGLYLNIYAKIYER